MVGFGGIYVEVLKDTVTRLDPLSQGEALEMLDELRMAPLLRGVRESRQSTGPRSPRTICRFAQLAVDVAELCRSSSIRWWQVHQGSWPLMLEAHSSRDESLVSCL
jgi:hypothetical protein